jgi:hypothetical protein
MDPAAVAAKADNKKIKLINNIGKQFRRVFMHVKVGSEIMRIAMSSEGKELNANLDPRFGRSAYFIIVESIKNLILGLKV